MKEFSWGDSKLFWAPTSLWESHEVLLMQESVTNSFENPRFMSHFGFLLYF